MKGFSLIATFNFGSNPFFATLGLEQTLGLDQASNYSLNTCIHSNIAAINSLWLLYNSAFIQHLPTYFSFVGLNCILYSII